MKKLFLVLGLLLVCLGILIVVSEKKITSSLVSDGKLQVATSFYPLYYFASQVGGDKATVFAITPASAEPHDYEPTTQDIARIEQSDLLVLNGGQLETWGEKIKDELKGKKTLVVTASDGVATKQLEEDGQTVRDPHIWLNPILALEEVKNIAKGFSEMDPTNASYYEANAVNLENRLKTLDDTFRSGLTKCTLKEFVTSHAAFGYLAERYGLTQIAISGVSPDEEPTSQKLAEITNIVKTKSIRVIFFESLVSPKLSETIASETGAETLVLDPLEGIPAEKVAQGADYFSVMTQNLANLETALQCQK